MVAIGGSLSFLSVLPSRRSTRHISVSSPTTITRSPTCRARFGVAIRSIPERLTRVTLTLYIECRRSFANVFPLILSCVTMIRRETSTDSDSCQSISVFRPIKDIIASSSARLATIFTTSSCWSTVSACGVKY